MAFDVAGGAYGRFMGRFSEPLAEPFADFAGVFPASALRVLDVGCGPGALTALLVERLGSDSVCGVDPSEPFVAAVRERLPGVDIRQAPAEDLPYGSAQFHAALAQLVVHFMADPRRGVGEMARVTAAGGVVAACVWDHGGGQGPLSLFWRAASELDPDVLDESGRPGAQEGELGSLLTAVGLEDVVETALTVTSAFSSFDEWWAPYTLGVGPAGDHVGRLDPSGRTALRKRCRELLPDPPFTVHASAWAARGVKAGAARTEAHHARRSPAR